MARYRASAAVGDKELPATWIAAANGRPAGMASLKSQDHEDITDLTPWFASLYVHPHYRGAGIGGALLDHVESEAKNRFGFDQIYLFTSKAADFYESRGWSVLRAVRDPMGIMEDGDVLMYKELR